MSYSSLGAFPSTPALNPRQLTPAEATAMRAALARLHEGQQRLLITSAVKTAAGLIVIGLVTASGLPTVVKVLVTIGGLVYVGLNGFGLWIMHQANRVAVETRGGQSWLVMG